MKRNKHLIKRESRLLISGIILFVFTIVWLCIRFYNSITTNSIIHFKIVVAIFVVMIIINYAYVYAEKSYLKNLIKSNRFNLIIANNGFFEQGEFYYERIQNGYIWTINVGSDIFIDLYCDCSQLKKEDIIYLENQGLIVMHNALRVVLSGWSGKWKISKLTSYLLLQENMVAQYKLNKIDKPLLASEAYWCHDS